MKTKKFGTVPHEEGLDSFLKKRNVAAKFLYVACEEAESIEDILLAFRDAGRAVGMSALAKQTGLSRGTLYEILSEDGNPTIKTLQKIASALGCEIRITLNEDPIPNRKPIVLKRRLKDGLQTLEQEMSTGAGQPRRAAIRRKTAKKGKVSRPTRRSLAR